MELTNRGLGYMEQFDEGGKTVEGVYRIDPGGKVARVIGREVERANGVLVSAGDKYLYVADNNNDVAGGCHASRDTAAAITAAGFTIERNERFRFAPGPGPAVPHIIGVARRA